MPPRRALFLAALVVAVASGAALRLTTRSSLTFGGRVHPLTDDDNYHLRRARFAVANYPRTILFDPMMNFPYGGVPIWPPLFDVALATPARLLDGAAASPAAIEARAAWVPLFLGVGAIALAGLFGRQAFGDAGGAAVALFVAVCPGHILWTQFGHSDQHVAESFFGLLALWLFLRCRDRADASEAAGRSDEEHGQIRAETAAGVALTLATLAWQGAIYWGAIFALSLFLEAARTRRSIFRAAVLVLGMPAVLLGLATAWYLRGFRPPLTYISFGFFQPLFLACLAGGTILLETLLGAARRRLSRRGVIARLATVAVAAAAVLPNARGLLVGIGRGVGYVVGETAGEVASATGYVSYPKGWLKGIFEARPLLADGPGLAARQLSFAFFLAPIVILLWVSRAHRGRRAGVHIALAIWGAVTLVLALSQRMDVYYAAPLAAAALVETARAAASRPGMSAGARGLAAIGVAGLLASPFVWSTPAQARAVLAPGSDLYATLDWMRRELPHPIDPYDPAFLTAPSPLPPPDTACAVLAPWSLGHLILYEAQLPVVANNFGYGFTDSLRFFLAETESDGLAIARKRRARWVVVTDLAPRLNDYAGYVGLPPSLKATPAGLAPTERYFHTLQSRLYDFDGTGLQTPELTVAPVEHFRLRFRSSSAIRRGGKWIARWKVFEIVD